MCPKWRRIPYVVHYFLNQLWSKVVHYIGDMVPFGTQTWNSAEITLGSINFNMEMTLLKLHYSGMC